MPPIQPTAEARVLISAAERDAKTVELLMQHPDAPVSIICFHVQQYLEKTIKPVLVSNGVVFHRTHDLEELADLLMGNSIELPVPKDDLRRLNPFAVTTRYEDMELSLLNKQTVLEITNHTHEWITRELIG